MQPRLRDRKIWSATPFLSGSERLTAASLICCRSLRLNCDSKLTIKFWNLTTATSCRNAKEITIIVQIKGEKAQCAAKYLCRSNLGLAVELLCRGHSVRVCAEPQSATAVLSHVLYAWILSCKVSRGIGRKKKRILKTGILGLVMWRKVNPECMLIVNPSHVNVALQDRKVIKWCWGQVVLNARLTFLISVSIFQDTS